MQINIDGKWVTIERVHGLYSKRLIGFLTENCGFVDTGHTKDVLIWECMDDYYNRHRTHQIIQRPKGMNRKTGESVVFTVMSALRFRDLGLEVGGAFNRLHHIADTLFEEAKSMCSPWYKPIPQFAIPFTRPTRCSQ